MSIMAVAPAAARARPSSSLGLGTQVAARRAPSPCLPRRGARRPASEPPSSPVTPTRSPGRAPSRPTSSSSESAHPVTATVSTSTGPRDHVPARDRHTRLAGQLLHAVDQLERLLRGPRAGPPTHRPRRRPRPSRPGPDSAVASAFQPMSRSPWVARRKCTPSTSVLIEVTAKARARVTAASSPVHRTSRPLRSARAVSIAAISSSSPTASPDPAPAARQGAGQPAGCIISPARPSGPAWVCRSHCRCRSRSRWGAPAPAARRPRPGLVRRSSGACSVEARVVLLVLVVGRRGARARLRSRTRNRTSRWARTSRRRAPDGRPRSEA